MTVVPLRCAPNVSAILRVREAPVALRRPYFPSPPALAGFPNPAADYIEESLDLNEYLVRNKVSTFFIRFQGDSLADLGVMDGDVGVVDRALDVEPGKLIVASVDGEIVAKVYEVIDGRPALVSRNARIAYPTLFLDRYQEHTLWGCITSIARRL